MSTRNENRAVMIRCTRDSEIVFLDIGRDELVECYGFFEANPPGHEPVDLPFSSETVRMWNTLHVECAFYLREAVLELLNYLELKGVPITLFPWQLEANDAAMTCMLDHRIYLDTSPLGAGKSFNTGKIAQVLDAAHTIAVSPAGVIPVWDQQSCAVPQLVRMSYGDVRGKRKDGGGKPVVTELKHGWLIRTDTVSIQNTRKGPVEVHHSTFEATPLFHQMCEEGLFLICDEIQHIRNDSGQQKAIRALMSAIRSHETAYAAFLSGSPFDKEEGAFRMMQTLNIIEEGQLIRVIPRSKNNRLGQVIQLGTKEAILFCQALEKRERARKKLAPIKGTSALERWVESPVTNKIACILPQKKEDAMKLIYDLYMAVIVPSLVISAPRPKIDFTHDIANGFYLYDEEDALRYLVQMSDIRGAFTTTDEGTIINDFTTLGRCLELMEYSGLPSVAKDITRVLDSNPRARCIVFMTYKKNYDRLLELLPQRHVDKGVEIVNGSVPPHKRTPMIEAFQGGESQIMLIGLLVGGAGLSFHDRIGGMETYSWIFPGYGAIDDYQATGRTYRPGVMSNCYTRFVYCRQYPAVHLISSLLNKSGVIRAAVNRGDILLPDAYRNLKMPEGTKMTINIPSKD